MKKEILYNQVSQAILPLSEGLSFLSESDYPLVVRSVTVEGDATTLDTILLQVLKQRRIKVQTPVQTLTADDFFQRTITVQDWMSDAEKATVARFQALVLALKERCIELAVFKVGAISIDVFVIGKTLEGELLVLQTKSIET